MTLDYTQENAFEFLKKSGLAKQILGSEDGIKIRYSRIPTHHGIPDRSGGKQYYRFVSDHLRAVIAISDESSTHRMIGMTSKYLIMDREAVEKFRVSWEILESLI